jgi:hypothetical protein
MAEKNKKGGKCFYDREKAGELRTSLLEDCIKVVNNDPEVEEWSDFKKQLILKMSTNLLPRLQEVTGAEGEPLQVSFDSAFKD